MSFLHALHSQTGVYLYTIPFDDLEILELLASGDREGIPVFEDGKATELMSVPKNNPNNNIPSFGFLSKILAIANGIGEWADAEDRRALIESEELS